MCIFHIYARSQFCANPFPFFIKIWHQSWVKVQDKKRNVGDSLTHTHCSHNWPSVNDAIFYNVLNKISVKMHYLCFKSLIYAGRAHSESELSQHQSVCLSYLENCTRKTSRSSTLLLQVLCVLQRETQFHVHGQHTFQPWCPMGCYCNLGMPVPQR